MRKVSGEADEKWLRLIQRVSDHLSFRGVAASLCTWKAKCRLLAGPNPAQVHTLKADIRLRIDTLQYGRGSTREVKEVQRFGADRKAKTLNRLDWDRFIRERTAGRVGPSGRKVGNRAVERDLRWLLSVFNWATRAGDDQTSSFLERNSLRGLSLPKEPSPRRPVMTQERYEAMLNVAGQTGWRFRLALILAHETGQLRWSDIDLERGMVTWRAQADKKGSEHATPLTEEAISALVKTSERNPARSVDWVFPSPRDSREPSSRFVLQGWWYRAERLVGLKRIKGLGFHSLRRKFADELRDAPLRDVQALGGWKDPATPLKWYQRSSEHM